MSKEATLRYLRMSPRKVRTVANEVRGKEVEAALDYLKFCPRDAARPLSKLVRSAIANAEQEKGVDVDNLVIQELFVNGGPTLKRWLPRARGRADRLLKKTSHVTVRLGEK